MHSFLHSQDNEPTKEMLRNTLREKQHFLDENSDKMQRCKARISDCRAQLDNAFDTRQSKRIILPVLLLIIGVYLLRRGLPIPAGVCLLLGAAMVARWLFRLIRRLKAHARLTRELQDYLKEYDELAEFCSALRLDAAELKKKLD